MPAKASIACSLPSIQHAATGTPVPRTVSANGTATLIQMIKSSHAVTTPASSQVVPGCSSSHCGVHAGRSAASRASTKTRGATRLPASSRTTSTRSASPGPP